MVLKVKKVCACQAEEQLASVKIYRLDPGQHSFIHFTFEKFSQQLKIPIIVFFMRAPSHTCV